MDSRIIIVLTLLCSSWAIANQEIKQNNEVKYAVSYCLSKTYQGTEFSSDAVYISGAYLQKGTYSLDMYESIRSFVDSYIQIKYVSKHDRNLDIMQCLDLSASTELGSVITKMANKASE